MAGAIFTPLLGSINPKFEVQNPKQARRSKIQMIKTKTFRVPDFQYFSLFPLEPFRGEEALNFFDE
jgi:hypothetical protein